MNEFSVWCGDKSYLAIEHSICLKCPKERWNDIACPCGRKEYLSNFFSFVGDKNFYCGSCKESKMEVLRKQLQEATTLEEGLSVLEAMRKSVDAVKE